MSAPEVPNVVQRIVNAWDCCGTCAGGVLAAYVREQLASEATDPGPEGDRETLTEADRDALACLCHAAICPLHNEGSDGYIEYQVDDLLARVERILADRRATDPGAGETVTEWGVRYTSPPERGWFPLPSEQMARDLVADDPLGNTVAGKRSVTRGPWQPVDPEATR